MVRLLLLTGSHLAAIAAGFAAGLYALPILTAPEAPAEATVEAVAEKAQYTARFRRDLPGSDLFHWGEGEVSVSREAVTFMGELAPGPDYKLYLAPEYVTDRDAFMRIKGRSLQVGDVKTFTNFIVTLTGPVDVDAYAAVVVWCESFGQFITAAQYR